MLIGDLFKDYGQLPEYIGIRLLDVNQVSLFGDRPINIAATRGSISELEVLVSLGADVNSAGEHGYTPLHNAVEQGMVVAVKWLLERGANKEAVNDAGMTPRELALVLDEKELVEMLNDQFDLP
ncbi:MULTISPECIES: ankyrin repeat domain-containing protein [Xanthomonas]|uniref:ankyrin repeat domain-containing protein n=2 Tax=Xanthomonas TaxID=338 RepID=UPI0001CED219|nr:MULTISPECIES: ankyrin repeat domain-containing protein [Xanthomonas]AMU97536.1 ankryin [Xanthomonas citri pv. aurantifolii]AMV03683.1 ankryin [Xanthomonas citri pv. aurantifolii]EFF49539.1 ankyrin repeat harboring protein [Xanthomonas citri pv. aurantifolii str. ICPB 10535]TBW93147.1 ankryin [Xanthomonas citri pv. aurantifolii]TBX02014.1 ankryin [Xanthomonas citri pv. aurantifolii]